MLAIEAKADTTPSAPYACDLRIEMVSELLESTLPPLPLQQQQQQQHYMMTAAATGVSTGASRHLRVRFHIIRNLETMHD